MKRLQKRSTYEELDKAANAVPEAYVQDALQNNASSDKISQADKSVKGKFSQGIFFIYAAANIRLRWQIPDSILAAQKKYCSKENLARMVKYRVKTIKKDEKNL